jgi:hypothetical protein
MLEQFENLQQEFAELEKRMQERGKEVFASVSKEVFEKDPKLVSFSWTQYTPYFNDGDECVFSVHDNLFFSYGDEEECRYCYECGKKVDEKWLDCPTCNSRTYEYDPDDVDGEDAWGLEWEVKNGRVTEEEVVGKLMACKLVSSIPTSAMKQMFGDHSRVIVYKDRVEVETCEHD